MEQEVRSIEGLSKKELLKKIREFEEERKKETLIMDSRMKLEGFTQKTDFWIHPISGGDDYQQTLYSIGEPTQTRIKNILRNSAVKDDYRMVAL